MGIPCLHKGWQASQEPAHPRNVLLANGEQDIVDLKLGQRVQVDDGTCPAGQVKEVRGAKMTNQGVSRTTSCVARFGPKSK